MCKLLLIKYYKTIWNDIIIIVNIFDFNIDK